MPTSRKGPLKKLLKSSSSSSSQAPTHQPSNAFICPISRHLMSDPVITPAGHTFERAAIEACNYLNFTPLNLSPIATTSSSDFPSLTPNLAIKIAILDWCNSLGLPHPLPLSQEAARALVEQLKDSPTTEIGTSNQEPSTVAPSTASRSTAWPLTLHIERDVFTQLQSNDVSIQESALVALNHAARQSSEHKISLCTERIIALIIPILYSLNNTIQVKAAASISKFVFEKQNRSKIVQWGVVSGLLNVLIYGALDARNYAARAIYEVSKEEENRMLIGSLKAMPLLLKCFCNHTLRSDVRRYAGLSLYELTLSPANLCLFEEMKAVGKLLEIVNGRSSNEVVMGFRNHAMAIMYNLVEGDKGREEMIESGVVEVMLKMMREREGIDVQCLRMMHWICMHCPAKFREVATEAGAEGVLANKKRSWGVDGEKMAKQMLDVILQREGRIRDEDEISVPEVRNYFFEYEEEEEEEEEEEGKLGAKAEPDSEIGL